MNKKFLSAILFGALMVGTTSTFVSCKDYDDEIDEITTEIEGIKTQLSALQAKVDGGKYVTNVVKSGEGIVITWNDNSTSTIETIKGDKGDKGEAVEITIDPTTKNWLIDGVDTGVCAEGKNGEAANGISAKSPSISKETGNWVVYEWNAEKQEYVGTDTGISAKGANAYVVDEGNYYTLNVAADKAGSEYTTVKLPKSPVVITEVEVMGLLQKTPYGESIEDHYIYNTGYDEYAAGKDIYYNFSLVGDLDDDRKEWNKEEGVKALAKGQALSTLSNGNLVVRVAPAKLDASQFSFSLINSQMGGAAIDLGTPVAYNGLLTKAAVSGNGLWLIPMSAKEGLTYENEADYMEQVSLVRETSYNQESTRNILFALQEEDGFATLYDLSFVRIESIDLNAAVAFVNGKNAIVSDDKYSSDKLQELQNGNINRVKEGTVVIDFDNASGIYDAHLHFDAATIQRWGITDIAGTSFKITKRPDDITAANLQVEVHYVTMNGEVKKEYVPMTVAKSYANATELANKNIEIAAINSYNKFETSLEQMFTDLGSNINLWKADVKCVVPRAGYYDKLGQFQYEWNIKVELDEMDEPAKASKFTVNLEDNTKKMDLEQQYYAELRFLDANNETLSTIIQPITFSVPDMNIFVEQSGVFVDGVAYAYMDETANRSGAAKNATYNLKGAFVELAKKMGTSTFNAALDDDTEIMKVNGAKKTSNDLATLNHTTGIENDDINNWTITLNNTNGLNANGTQMGYNKELIVKIKNVKYLNVYEYKDQVYTFKIKVLSPILEGKVTAVGGEVIVPATKQGGYQVNDSHVKGYTYNNEVYSIFSDKAAPDYWKRKEINAVTFTTGNENVFTCDQTGSDYVKNGNTETFGSVTVYPKNLKETTSDYMTVTVKDAWGYKLTQKVKVTVKVGE